MGGSNYGRALHRCLRGIIVKNRIGNDIIDRFGHFFFSLYTENPVDRCIIQYEMNFFFSIYVFFFFYYVTWHRIERMVRLILNEK